MVILIARIKNNKHNNSSDKNDNDKLIKVIIINSNY